MTEETEEEYLANQEVIEDIKEDEMEEQSEISQEVNEGYGSPEPEQRLSAHSFLHKATFESSNTLRTTFLDTGELGRPLFTVRTLLDLKGYADHYLYPMLISLGLNNDSNYISKYFQAKTGNVTDSGMSNKGFAMNLNVTQKKDLTKKKSSGNTENLKGGIK